MVKPKTAIEQNRCYHSFFYLFTIFINNICNLIRIIQILITIFVKEI